MIKLNCGSDIMNKFLEAIKNQNYYENFITRSVKNSNAIEGNTLSYAETYSILFVDESLPLQNVNPRELYEAINLKYALTHSLKNIGKLDNGIIIKINELSYNYENSDLPLIENIANFHINFEHVHPFEDGNGRTGRVLINHELISSGEIPIVIPEERRVEYFEYLANYNIDGLAHMIRELQQVELNKMKEYGVEF